MARIHGRRGQSRRPAVQPTAAEIGALGRATQIDDPVGDSTRATNRHETDHADLALVQLDALEITVVCQIEYNPVETPSCVVYVTGAAR